MKTTEHIIEKVLVEINTEDIGSADNIKNEIEMFLKEELFPEIEGILEKYDRKDMVIRFDLMNINLTVSEFYSENAKRIRDEVIRQIESQISKQFESFPLTMAEDNPWEEKQNMKQYSLQKKQEDVFLYYLEKGYFPWYGNHSLLKEFIVEESWQKSLGDKIFIERLKNLLKEERVFHRFVYQCPQNLILKFLKQLNTFRIKTKKTAFEKLPEMPDAAKIIFFQTLFTISVETQKNRIISSVETWLRYIRKYNSTKSLDLNKFLLALVPDRILADDDFQPILNRILSGVSLITAENRPEIKLKDGSHDDLNIDYFNDGKEKTGKKELLLEPAFFDEQTREILVQNAGLIILHPFLKHFFLKLRITGENGQILKNRIFQAVQILHYLATGDEEFPEGNLVFEKFICSLPLNFPLPKKSLLTKSMKEEAHVLLRETVKSWPALKNTSPVGLQQLFLQRKAKLVQKEERYKLIVERKAQDVLLEKLGWNISILKFPWQKKLLTVEW